MDVPTCFHFTFPSEVSCHAENHHIHAIKRNKVCSTTLHFRSIINYGLIAPWIFIGSSSIVIGVCLVIVRKRKQFAVESKGVSEKSAAKQREIRHTVFMDKKGVDAFPGYRSKQTMLPKDQVWLLCISWLSIIPLVHVRSFLLAK